MGLAMTAPTNSGFGRGFGFGLGFGLGFGFGRWFGLGRSVSAGRSLFFLDLAFSPLLLFSSSPLPFFPPSWKKEGHAFQRGLLF